MAFQAAAKPKSILGYHRLLSPTAAVRVSPLCLGGMNFGDAWYENFFCSVALTDIWAGRILWVIATRKHLLRFSIIFTVKAGILLTRSYTWPHANQPNWQVTAPIITREENLSSGSVLGWRKETSEIRSSSQPSTPPPIAVAPTVLQKAKSSSTPVETAPRACASHLIAAWRTFKPIT